MAPFELAAELEAQAARGLARTRRTLESPQGVRVRADGRDYLAFCSNDYLGLAAHPELIAAARDAAAECGVGAGASHLITGHHAEHAALEAALARHSGQPRALLFSAGYLANLAVVTAVVGRGDAVFADRLNHASLNDAALLSRAAFRRYAHGDLAMLERQLAAARARRKLVVTDAVFSMDGDIAPLAALLELCERYDAGLLVDDAHGYGVLGTAGRGTPAHLGLDVSSSRLIYMATLGKAAGVSGAFVAGSEALIESLIQRARPYIYTTAMPPLLARAARAALALIESSEGNMRRARVAALAEQLKGELAGCRWPLRPSATAIQPLIIGGAEEALAVSAALAAQGLLVPAIRPPTVPAGSARLRISLSAAHEPGHVTALARALCAL